MDMKRKNELLNKKSGREFVAGFTAGAVCLGIVALTVLLIFYL